MTRDEALRAAGDVLVGCGLLSSADELLKVAEWLLDEPTVQLATFKPRKFRDAAGDLWVENPDGTFDCQLGDCVFDTDAYKGWTFARLRARYTLTEVSA